MIIKPRIRGFICTTAHPVGCARGVEKQRQTVVDRGELEGPKKVLVLGCSGGFGLASRVVSAFGSGAATIGVSFEKEPSEKRTATAGWYNNLAFEAAAREQGVFAKTFDGDAFSDEMRANVIEAIKADLGEIDLLVYSLAPPVRPHPRTGELHRSVIKPLGEAFETKTLVVDKGVVQPVTVEPADEAEAEATVHVMGGEDWEFWIESLAEAGVLAKGFQTVAFSYLGSELTKPIYRGGTLGRAKEDLDRACRAIDARLAGEGRARVAVLKAIVSQASTAIPVVPLYISLLYRVMQEAGSHETCIEHVDRLFRTGLYGDSAAIDDGGRLRIDDWEMEESIQAEVARRWDIVDSENIAELGDLARFQREFMNIFGFEHDDVDYDADVDPMGISN